MNLCGCGAEAVYYADNNESGEIKWYCEEHEEHREEKYGCAMIIEEGCGCYPNDPCACGCDGSGVYV